MPEIDPGEHPRQIDEARFVYMGRLDREKDIGLMIQGFSALPAKTGARLTIVGEGPQQEELKQLAATLGVRDRVEFTGRLDDVTPALIASDFYLSTSQSEGMSNSMLEAMSYGLVPIVSHVSGVEDIVEDNRNGLIFAAGDVDGLKAALENAISMDPQTYRCFSHNARDTLAARFSMESVTSRHLELYERLAHP
jgi:glycosyltransferase involved in cell wall biosynthesis